MSSVSSRINLSSNSTVAGHSGTSSSILSQQQTIPTPLDGLTALSSIGSSSLHQSNSTGGGGSSGSLGTPDLGMSHWLSDSSSNAGEFVF